MQAAAQSYTVLALSSYAGLSFSSHQLPTVLDEIGVRQERRRARPAPTPATAGVGPGGCPEVPLDLINGRHSGLHPPETRLHLLP